MAGYSLWDHKRVGHDLVTKQKTTKIICRYILEILQETTAVKLVFQKIKSHNWLVSQYMYKLCLYIVY